MPPTVGRLNSPRFSPETCRFSVHDNGSVNTSICSLFLIGSIFFLSSTSITVLVTDFVTVLGTALTSLFCLVPYHTTAHTDHQDLEFFWAPASTTSFTHSPAQAPSSQHQHSLFLTVTSTIRLLRQHITIDSKGLSHLAASTTLYPSHCTFTSTKHILLHTTHRLNHPSLCQHAILFLLPGSQARAPRRFPARNSSQRRGDFCSTVPMAHPPSTT